MYRFARSNYHELESLKLEIAERYQQNEGNRSLVDFSLGLLPKGLCKGQPILNTLFDALLLRRPFTCFKNFVTSDPNLSWMSDPSLPLPPNFKVQSESYKIFSKWSCIENNEGLLANKLVTTFGEEFANNLILPETWLKDLDSKLRLVKTHVSMCLFKTWVGGWTTSIRMHEEKRLNCIFGCTDEPDSLDHYLRCAPLWHIVAEASGLTPPFLVEERVGLKDPSELSLLCLSFAFHGYHYSKSLLPQTPQYVQTACLHACKAYKSKLGL